jgi:hypothetical protein
VVDAELIHSTDDVVAEAKHIAQLQMLHVDQLLVGIALGASDGAKRDIDELDDDECTKAMDFLEAVASEQRIVTGFDEDGRILSRKAAKL